MSARAWTEDSGASGVRPGKAGLCPGEPAAQKSQSAAADELVRVGHRLDGVLSIFEGLFGDKHLLRGVSELGRMLVDGQLELRLDPGRVQDRLDLLGFREIPRHRQLHHRPHAPRPPPACPAPHP